MDDDDDSAGAAESSIADIAEQARPSVVRVGVNCAPQSVAICEGTGSGWFYDDQGHIVTNNHVVTLGGQIQAPPSIIITSDDGRNLEASVVGRDPRTDLALLQVDANPEDYPPLPRGNIDETRIGEPVIAIGYALDLGTSPSVTTGVLSARERRIIEGTAGIYGALQTDAAINPGNSGGPLLNHAGEVIGVNTAQAVGAQGIGFAVSIDMVDAVVSLLLEDGTVERGFIGIGFRDVTPGLADELGIPVDHGVRIEQVGPGTPAEQAGLQQGDVIVKVAGEEVATSSDVNLALLGHAPGSTIEIVVYRDGEEITIDLELGEVPTLPAR